MTEEVAFAMPHRPGADGGGVVPFPQPLPAADARRIRRVFALQEAGDIPAALALAAQVTDTTLLGHVLADRYLRPAWRGDAAELSAWLADHADLPDAPAIHARYASLMPKGAVLPEAPAATPPLADPVPEPGGVSRSPVLDRAVQARMRGGQFEAAIRLVRHTRGLEPAYAGLLQAELARALFFANRDAEALGAAEAGFRAGEGRPALAAFVAGLAAWRLDRPDLARGWFESAWRAPDGAAPLRAGAAFWAARAVSRTGGSFGLYNLWLGRAVREPATFYGRIARELAGMRAGRPPVPERVTIGPADVAMVDATPSGHRAFALLQVGQTDRAEAELRRLWGMSRDVPGMGRAIALVAEQAGLSAFATAMQTVLEDREDPSSVPAAMPRLRPSGGFRIDQALVYGVARVESNFDAAAVSPMGATGLMQLMPVTASFVAGGGKPVAPASVAHMLRDPGGNLQLGQRYLMFLADALDGDLLRMLAAYNTGLGGFNRWNGDVRHMDDPLMFIESIPVDETRAYVSRALYYTWTYAAQLGLPAPSLDDLAAGLWPRLGGPRELAGRLH